MLHRQNSWRCAMLSSVQGGWCCGTHSLKDSWCCVMLDDCLTGRQRCLPLLCLLTFQAYKQKECQHTQQQAALAASCMSQTGIRQLPSALPLKPVNVPPAMLGLLRRPSATSTPRRPTGAWQLRSLTPLMLSTTKLVRRSYISVIRMSGRLCMHEQHSMAAIWRAACAFMMAAQWCSHVCPSLQSLRAWLMPVGWHPHISFLRYSLRGPQARQLSWLAVRLLDPAGHCVSGQLAAQSILRLALAVLLIAACLPAALQELRRGAPEQPPAGTRDTPAQQEQDTAAPVAAALAQAAVTSAVERAQQVKPHAACDAWSDH